MKLGQDGRRYWLGFIAAALMAVLVPSDILAQQTQGAEQGQDETDRNRSAQVEEPKTTGAPPSFAPMVNKLLPAVVNISTKQAVVSASAGGIPPLANTPLEEFFRDFFGGQMPEGRSRQVSALGSGFIVDPEGYVVTNNHVVETAQSIQVIMADDQTFDAELVGSDPATDIALLKVKSDKPLPFVEWGSSDRVQIGDWVIAVGNPFGLGGTVTTGVLSARARDLRAGPYDDFLQTDAAINQGNSGGPLFDAEGQVIGVNTVILSPSGGNVGIGFAVPASTALPVVQQLRETGSVQRGWLGVQLQPITDSLTKVLNLPDDSGALVADVVDGGPAAEAGLREGDVILNFDGQQVDDVRDLPRIVANTAAGKQVEITIWRNGQKETVQATVEQRSRAVAGTEGDGTGKTASATGGPLGLSLAPLDPRTRRELGLERQAAGALVTEVKQGSPAAESGIRAGDVIVSVNQQPVENPQDAAQRLQSAAKEKSGIALLRINRDGSYLFVGVPV